MTSLPICFSADNNYAPHLGASIASLLKTNPKNKFHFYILDGGISTENKQKIESLKSIRPFQLDFIPMDSHLFQDCKIPANTHFTIAAFFRWKILSLFPNLDRILYLDCDLIVLKDIKPLFEIDLGNHWVAMVPDYFSDRISLERGIYNRPYYNSGVILFNLPLCRQVHLERKLFQAVAEIPETPYVDQDVLNDVAGAHTLTLDPRYNTQFHPFVEALGDRILSHISEIVILHYTSGQKPWKDIPYHPLNRYYFTYLNETPWKREKPKMKHIEHFLFNYIKTDKSKKWQVLGLTLFKKVRKKDYSRKFYICGIPVWRTRPDKWRIKYEQLLSEQSLYKSDIDKIKEELNHLEAVKLLHQLQK